jgi:hypothetical protein
MRAWSHCLALALFCTFGVAHAADTGVTYKWVDENGVTHYGDSIPPQYAKKESSVLNKQGVVVRRNDAQKSPEQLAEEARAHEAVIRQKQHDAFLLTTYPTVRDIESLRDERLEQISGQRRAAEAYIEGLSSRLSARGSQSLRGLALRASCASLRTRYRDAVARLAAAGMAKTAGAA